MTFTQPQNAGITRYHEVGLYSDERSFLDGFTQFIGSALIAGKAVTVVATESHRGSILRRLQARGFDIGTAIETGRYLSLDAVDTLSTFMVDGSPDPVRFQKAADDLIMGAAEAVNGDPARIAACGEGTALLWAQGNLDAAIRLEHLWNEIAIARKVATLCGYSLGIRGGMDNHTAERICAEHSAVYSL